MPLTKDVVPMLPKQGKPPDANAVNPGLPNPNSLDPAINSDSDIDEGGVLLDPNAKLSLEPLKRLSRDLKFQAGNLSEAEARYLVNTYYSMQEYRKAMANQVLPLAESGKPHETINWFQLQAATLEDQVKAALTNWAGKQPVCRWAMSNKGVGPIIAAGLAAHISFYVDVKDEEGQIIQRNRRQTAGSIWRFAGLDPTVKWEKGQKRPWNGQLKTLCWKIGESFVKVSGKPDAVYGQLYLVRKKYEIERNENGANAELCQQILASKNWSKSTEAYKHLSKGTLPPAQIYARAKRYAVKIFLSHYHAAGYEIMFGEKPPKPFAIAILGHAHMIEVPNQDLIVELKQANSVEAA